MAALRYLTLVWPGLPWLWLRGSRLGLVLALAFAVTVDVAVLTTFIWPELTGLGFAIGLWTATAALWLAAERHLEALLAIAPTDGEAQLLWGTLLRRVGRVAEAREALAKLSRSDSGGRWRAALARELAMLESDAAAAAADGPTILPLTAATAVPAPGRDAAA